MDEQLALLHDAIHRQAPGGAPVDVSVSRQAGDCIITLRGALGTIGAAVPMRPVSTPIQAPMPAAVSLDDAGVLPSDGPPGGITRAYTRNSFYEDDSEVPNLLAEIDRLKRKALSRGVVLTSRDEEVPAEDVVMLRQIFSIADDTGDGRINQEQLGQLHTVLGEPLSDAELHTAFKAMDVTRVGSVSFDDFLSWYTLAHSSSGILSRKGNAYTSRFAKMMGRVCAYHTTPNHACHHHDRHAVMASPRCCAHHADADFSHDAAAPRHLRYQASDDRNDGRAQVA